MQQKQMFSVIQMVSSRHIHSLKVSTGAKIDELPKQIYGIGANCYIQRLLFLHIPDAFVSVTFCIHCRVKCQKIEKQIHHTFSEQCLFCIAFVLYSSRLSHFIVFHRVQVQMIAVNLHITSAVWKNREQRIQFTLKLYVQFLLFYVLRNVLQKENC